MPPKTRAERIKAIERLNAFLVKYAEKCTHPMKRELVLREMIPLVQGIY